MPTLSVIIPARDADRTLAWVLGGLAGQDYGDDWELIVVDDGSADGTIAAIEDSPLDARIIRTTGDGPARARNAGASAAQGQLLAFLDADCRPTSGWLSAGASAIREADLVQGAVLPDPDVMAGPFDRSLLVPRMSGLHESANLFVRRELFERIGGFESWLRPKRGIELGEDVLFGWRAHRLGAPMAFSEAALAHHAVFKRGAAAYAAERVRRRYFPAMARRIPELRDALFYRRWFLNRRTAAFDLALAGALTAVASRRSWPLLAASPYAKAVVSKSAPAGSVSLALEVLAAELAADTIGLGALLVGSAAARTLVL